MNLVRFTLRALAVFGVLVALWNYQLIYQLAKPAVIGLNPSWSQVTVSDGSHTTNASEFVYPKLGIQAPLSVNPATSPLVSQDWSVIKTDLLHGVSLAFPGSSFTNASLAFVTGHSSDVTQHPYDAVFAALGQAKTGDSFVLTFDSTAYVYPVVEAKQLSPSDVHGFMALNPSNDTTQRVALVTCWPPLTTTKRLVIIGERTKSPNNQPSATTRT